MRIMGFLAAWIFLGVPGRLMGSGPQPSDPTSAEAADLSRQVKDLGGTVSRSRDEARYGTQVSGGGVRHLIGRYLTSVALPDDARNNEGLKNHIAAGLRFKHGFSSQYDWPHVTDEGLAVLEGQEWLKSLSWWGNTGDNGPRRKVGPTLRKVLPTLRGLEDLYLESGVTDDDLALLTKLPKLTSLSVGGNVTDAGLKHLAGMQQLKSLNLSETKITDSGLRDLARLPHLQELCLYGTSIGDDGMKHLASAPDLRKLDIRETRVTPAGLRHLKGRKLSRITAEQALLTEELFVILFPNLPPGPTLEGIGCPLTDLGLELILTRREVTDLGLSGKFPRKPWAGSPS